MNVQYSKASMLYHQRDFKVVKHLKDKLYLLSNYQNCKLFPSNFWLWDSETGRSVHPIFSLIISNKSAFWYSFGICFHSKEIHRD